MTFLEWLRKHREHIDYLYMAMVVLLLMATVYFLASLLIEMRDSYNCEVTQLESGKVITSDRMCKVVNP